MRRVTLPALTIEAIRKRAWDTEHLAYDHLFEDYLRGGIMPFSLEDPAGGRLVVEVGGKGKGRQQFKGTDISKTMIMVQGSAGDDPIKRSLSLAGFLPSPLLDGSDTLLA